MVGGRGRGEVLGERKLGTGGGGKVGGGMNSDGRSTPIKVEQFGKSERVLGFILQLVDRVYTEIR